MSYLSELGRRLRTAGIEPDDTDDVKLKKSLLMFAMGLTVAAPVLWLALYGAMGLNLPASVPFGYQLVSLGTLLVYLVTRNFDLFRVLQLSLYLFFPFVLQWQLGDFITASGFVLWGLLAPIVAVLVYSPRDSIPWFVAYIVLIVAAAGADYYLFAEGAKPAPVPPKTIVVFFALNFVAISSVVYFLLRYAAVERDKSKARMEEAHRLLQAEQERSERLLLNILPGPVAERLKMEDGTIADGFADVTVMFADIVNFTTLAEGMSPNQIFAMLNKVFSSFDSLAERHGLEKIKTIGDAYMVAGGLNDESSVNYSEAIAQMALDMRDLLASDLSVNDHRLEIRMGIGTGPVVAGVVGKKKFIYDLWGDTVNLASRITAESVPGMVQVDVTTYRRLRNRFEFDPPKTLYLKGKGDTTVYTLRGRKAAAGHEAAA
ncbi:MAG TPA: adenylate/guanylate cyclase domain-containing protein [Burkholderiales bacterium]|jgi:adenylate cyclase|nr:adenylate/guanylate cyclase domain-containing protein [Burkholderiales bacterium]